MVGMAGGWWATGHNQASITLLSHTHTGGHQITDNTEREVLKLIKIKLQNDRPELQLQLQSGSDLSLCLQTNNPLHPRPVHPSQPIFSPHPGPVHPPQPDLRPHPGPVHPPGRSVQQVHQTEDRGETDRAGRGVAVRGQVRRAGKLKILILTSRISPATSRNVVSG